jgi:hypothetical protein
MKFIRRPTTPKENTVSITTQTYSFLGDPKEPTTIPDSALVLAAARIVAACQERGRGIVPHGPGNLPLELVRLSAAARQLVLEAAAFGNARDAAAASEATAAAAALEATWLAGTVAPPPVAPVAEMPEEPGPVGRPKIGSLLHRWTETDGGRCSPCWVVAVLGGAPDSATSVTPANPYLRVADVGGDQGRPVFARWIPRPKPDLSPGFRPPIVSWHRNSQQECPSW